MPSKDSGGLVLLISSSGRGGVEGDKGRDNRDEACDV